MKKKNKVILFSSLLLPISLLSLPTVSATVSQQLNSDVGISGLERTDVVLEKIKNKSPKTADEVFSIDENLTLNENEINIYNILKQVYNESPEFVKKIVNKIVITKSNRTSFGWTYSQSGIVYLNTKYWNETDGLNHEIEVLAHEVGHTIDGASLTAGDYNINTDTTIDPKWKSYSRDKNIQSLLWARYPNVIYYESYASLFAEYLLMFSERKPVKSDLDNRIQAYGNTIFDKLYTKEEKGFIEESKHGDGVSFDLETFPLDTLKKSQTADELSYDLPLLEIPNKEEISQQNSNENVDLSSETTIDTTNKSSETNNSNEKEIESTKVTEKESSIGNTNTIENSTSKIDTTTEEQVESSLESSEVATEQSSSTITELNQTNSNTQSVIEKNKKTIESVNTTLESKKIDHKKELPKTNDTPSSLLLTSFTTLLAILGLSRKSKKD